MAKKSCVIHHLCSADESKEFKIKTKAKVFYKEALVVNVVRLLPCRPRQRRSVVNEGPSRNAGNAGSPRRKPGENKKKTRSGTCQKVS